MSNEKSARVDGKLQKWAGVLIGHPWFTRKTLIDLQSQSLFAHFTSMSWNVHSWFAHYPLRSMNDKSWFAWFTLMYLNAHSCFAR